ncbi:MAG TPA: lactate utilization protein, partial [Deltaproteobacteria bacterium]|nr:lactate utilization protein [Deltaproteobacteria bacterium]
AGAIFFDQVLPQLTVKTVSWGDSMTMKATGVLNELEKQDGIEIIRTFEKDVAWKELIERRRQALLCDLFLTGSNAVTEDGRLVNLDMIGNRTGGISFGPRKVVLFIGRNKITRDLESAIDRVRNIAAPLNAKRHDFQTPCAKTGRCHNCSSPQRICNSWSIIDKCYPKGRIKIILINADLGL